jgi:putative hydrolase of the HAD superfamily
VSGFDAVLFDLDNTLCRHEQSADAIYRGAFEWAGADTVGKPADLWAALDGDPPPNDERGYLADGFERVVAQYDAAVDPERLATGFVETVDYRKVSLLPGAEAALRAARDNGAVGLVTNGPASRQAVKVDALGIENRFDTVVYAGDLPHRKPHPDPFERALRALDASAPAALYVGDSVEYDVVGARRASIRVAWVPESRTGWRAGEWPGVDRPTYVFDRIDDPVDLLGD